MNQQDLDKFKQLRSLIKTQIHKAYKEYVRKTENNIRNDSKQFWNFINSKKGITRIPGKIILDDVSFNTPVGIVNAFKNYFNSVYQNSTVFEGKDLTFNNNPIITITTISEDEVLCAVKKLKNKLTAGSDLILSFLLKDCVGVLVKPILTIINLSLKTSVFPEM